MQEIYIKGLSNKQILRLLENKRITEIDIEYANIRSLIFVQTDKDSARILFDNKSDWNHKFEGNSDDFFKIISGA